MTFVYRSSILFILGVLTPIAACNLNPRNPDAAVRHLMEKVAEENYSELFELLHPDQQRLLNHLAEQASKGITQGEPFKGSDMLAANLGFTKDPIGEIVVSAESENSATVTVRAREGSHSEVIELSRIDGKWVIKLPRLEQVVREHERSNR